MAGMKRSEHMTLVGLSLQAIAIVWPMAVIKLVTVLNTLYLSSLSVISCSCSCHKTGEASDGRVVGRGLAVGKDPLLEV